MAVQSFSAAHATTYGDGPHKHDGVLCAVSIFSHQDVAPIPVLDTPTFVIVPVRETPERIFQSALYLTPQGRAPPPRAPPFTQ